MLLHFCNWDISLPLIIRLWYESWWGSERKRYRYQSSTLSKYFYADVTLLVAILSFGGLLCLGLGICSPVSIILSVLSEFSFGKESSFALLLVFKICAGFFILGALTHFFNSDSLLASFPFLLALLDSLATKSSLKIYLEYFKLAYDVSFSEISIMLFSNNIFSYVLPVRRFPVVYRRGALE